MPSDAQTPPAGVTFGAPATPPPGVTFGAPATPPEGVSFGAPSDAQTAPAPAPSGPGNNPNDPGYGMEKTKGQLKGVGRTLAGLLDLYSKASTGGTGGVVPTVEPLQHAAGAAANWINRHTVLNNPAQKQGNLEESMAEFLVPGLLEEHGAGAGAEAAEQAPKLSEQLAAQMKKAKVLEEHPDLHALVRIGLNTLKGGAQGAARGAAEQGTQALIKTGGDTEAATQAAETGAEYGGVMGGAVAGGATTLQRAAQRVGELRPGTEEIAGVPFETKPGEPTTLLRRTPKGVATDPASAQADTATGNIARDAVGSIGNRIEGMREPEPEAPSIISKNEAMTVARARQQVGLYNRIINGPMGKELGPRQLAQRVAARDDLVEQIGRYNEWANEQASRGVPYPGLNVADAQANTNSLHDAGQIITGHYTDALKAARNPEEAAQAQSGIDDGNFLQNFHNLLDDKFGGVSAGEEAQTKGKLGQLTRVFEPGKSWNDEVEDFLNQGNNRALAQRTIGDQGILNTKRLGTAFNNSEDRAQARGLIDSIGTAIKRHYQGIAGYMRGAGTGVIGATEMALALSHHLGMMGEVAGVPAVTGAYAGIRNYVTDRLATDPDFLNAFEYAIKSRLPPRTAAPLLLSRMLARGTSATAATAANAPQEQPQGVQ